ncbi:hypothetical protein [Ensifer sp. B1-9]|uniref:hypothetical protein n=1 Tax=Ensifer sp. B1-9 TaxID=3141455 RepID=UPI003D1B473B
MLLGLAVIWKTVTANRRLIVARLWFAIVAISLQLVAEYQRAPLLSEGNAIMWVLVGYAACWIISGITLGSCKLLDVLYWSFAGITIGQVRARRRKREEQTRV